MKLKGSITNLGTLLAVLPGCRGEATWLEDEQRAWRRVAGSGCAQRGTLSLGRRQQGDRRVDQNTSRGRRMTRFRRERGRRKWAPKKEVRNCGGGSCPWKRRGKGEKRMECLHFLEGKARASPNQGGCGRRLGEGAPGRTEAAAQSPGSPGIPAPAALPEPLLSRSVPELQLYPLARLDLQQAREEVHADGGVAGGGAQPGKAALGEAMQEARLAHGGVPDYDEAELVDPNGLHHSRASPPHPPSAGQVPRRELSLQHLPDAHPLASSIFLR